MAVEKGSTFGDSNVPELPWEEGISVPNQAALFGQRGGQQQKEGKDGQRRADGKDHGDEHLIHFFRSAFQSGIIHTFFSPFS